MAIHTKKIESIDAEEAALNHASKGVEEYVSTKWADLGCLNNGVHFKPEFLTNNEKLVKESIEQLKNERLAAAQNKPERII